MVVSSNLGIGKAACDLAFGKKFFAKLGISDFVMVFPRMKWPLEKNSRKEGIYSLFAK